MFFDLAHAAAFGHFWTSRICEENTFGMLAFLVFANARDSGAEDLFVFSEMMLTFMFMVAFA